jgi:hypothetical protein
MTVLSPELIRSALRVLCFFNEGISPDPQDIETIQAALPSTVPPVPPNVLAAYIVDRAAQTSQATTPPDEHGHTVQAQTQAALVRVLSADLELAFTLLHTAKIAGKTDPDGSLDALTRAGVALQQVRRLLRRVREPNDAIGIRSRADELESALAASKRFVVR